MLAASFGVTEVFKRIYRIPQDSAPLIKNGEFSLFELTSDIRDIGPPLPSIPLPNTLLLGAGAIGNAIALLISQLPLTGSLTVMDKQNFGEENFTPSGVYNSCSNIFFLWFHSNFLFNNHFFCAAH